MNFILLQINDSLFPIGGYSHSYGLETYVQKGIVTDTKTAAKFIENKIKYSLLYGEILSARLAYEYAENSEISDIIRLCGIAEASKAAKETRNASKKLASRFIKTVNAMEIEYKNSVFNDVVSRAEDIKLHYAVVYGVFCFSAGIDIDEALQCFLYSQTSAMATNAVKLVPLSQTDGQRLLAESCRLFCGCIEKVYTLDEDMLYMSNPAFEIRCMQHERLYSRIYMS